MALSGGVVIQRHDEIKFGFKTLPPELSSHKTTQVVAQMLKRPKEWLHQQKNEVIYLLGISGNIKLIAFILDVRSTNLDAPSNIQRKL